MAKFKFKKRSYEAGKKASEARGRQEDFPMLNKSIKRFIPQEGESIIRIIPPTWEDAQSYGLTVFVHYGVGANNEAVLCSNHHGAHKGKNLCPICAENKRLYEEGKEEEARQFRKARREAIYLVDRDDEAEIKIWLSPASVSDDILGISIDSRRKANLNIDDPNEGFDVIFNKTGKGIQTKYGSIKLDTVKTKLGCDEILDFAVENPLRDLFVTYEPRDIAEAMGLPFTTRGELSDSGSDNSSEDDSKEVDEKTQYTLEDLENMDLEALIKIGESLGISSDGITERNRIGYVDDVFDEVQSK